MLAGLFGLDGRIGRGMWWLGHLILTPIIIFCIVTAIAGIASKNDALMSAAGLSFLLIIITIIPCAYIGISTTIQRYHDRGKSGWWFLMNFVPLIGPLWVLIECGFCSGDEGDNAYGPPPSAGRRMASLKSEVSGIARSSAIHQKVDDDYMANYAKKIAMQQVTQQTATASSFSQNGAKPVFGKR